MARLPARSRWLMLAAGIAVMAPAARPANARGSDLALRDLGRSYGLTATRLDEGQKLRLTSRWTALEFTAGSREASWNGLRLFLSEPVRETPEELRLASSDWQAIVRPLLDPGAEPPATGAVQTVVVDAGHGGADPGTENRRLKLQEKTFTLDVARRLQQVLTARGFRVLLTRANDRRLGRTQVEDLRARARMAIKVGADVFISLHFNSLPAAPKVHGIETYALTPAGQRSTASSRHSASDRKSHPGNRQDHWNMVLNGAVHRQLVSQLKAEDRGLKHARFAVLRDAECPAVLVEAGFLSNTAEAKKIGTAGYRQQIAEAIGSGIEDYRSRVATAIAATD